MKLKIIMGLVGFVIIVICSRNIINTDVIDYEKINMLGICIGASLMHFPRLDKE